MDKTQRTNYHSAAHLLEEMQEVAFDPGLDGNTTTKTTSLMANIAIAFAAAALERIAAATERRNELLAEFNADSKTSAAAHTEKMAESVNTFLDAHFDKGEEL